MLTFRSAGRRERVDAARSDLVATVSHEIRSPLTSVKGFTSTMLRKWDRFSDEQKRTMLETINHDADRVTRLLKELLAVSRIDAGRVQMHREMADVVEIVEGLVDRVRHREEGLGRDLVLTVDGAPPRMFVDPDKIEQVFSNLLENALKYAPDSQVRITLTLERDQLHAVVADDGPGIPPDQSRRIFEKFGRGRDQRRSGTGLGLYITRGLVHAHGGQVWCDESDTPGATFHVTLPTAAAEPTRRGPRVRLPARRCASDHVRPRDPARGRARGRGGRVRRRRARGRPGAVHGAQVPPERHPAHHGPAGGGGTQAARQAAQRVQGRLHRGVRHPHGDVWRPRRSTSGSSPSGWT